MLLLGFLQFQKSGAKWGWWENATEKCGRRGGNVTEDLGQRGENVTEGMLRDMVESAGLNTSEDREWIVQAARGVEPAVEVGEEVKEEGEGGAESPLILRHPRRQSRGHVTFNQQDDIRPISTLLERSRSAKKEKKEREREERELADVKEEVVAGVNIIIPISFSLLLGCGGDQGKEELTLSLLLDHQQHEKEEEET